MSEFGKGLSYCLGLFLAHQGDYFKLKNSIDARLWFSAASDHLYELQIPEHYPIEIKDKLKKLQETSLDFGHGFQQKSICTDKDMDNALTEAKDLLIEIDKINGVGAEKGDYE